MYQIYLFWNGTLHISDGFSVHHQEYKTLHTATGICQTDTVIRLLLYAQSYPDDGRKNRPKHIECHYKINKFDTLVHLVGFTIGISTQIFCTYTNVKFHENPCSASLVVQCR